ncbi:hypothetical protein CALCODRAFT_230711 [Calocera cornea HHB12733]|uniref:Uncharacterized protein n=1 Tax=Calocera cornea HHB12733 TaxID=1353952 RepID=A0A165GZE4_9BASI|nr:hypothetical protein CALCODRAFT_230711 [Calocera cornea HHB12733]
MCHAVSSAWLVKALLGDSAVLALQNAPGQCSLSLLSICTIHKARAFFEYGALSGMATSARSSCPFTDDDGLRAFSAEDAAVLEASCMRLGEDVLYTVVRPWLPRQHADVSSAGSPPNLKRPDLLQLSRYSPLSSPVRSTLETGLWQRYTG